MRGRILPVFVTLACVGAAACSPMLDPYGYGPRRRAAPRAYDIPPIGRWDQVVSLKTPLVISVILADGTTQTGRFAGATAAVMRVIVQGAEITVPRDDVMRVDVAQTLPAGKGTLKRVALGAAGMSLATVLSLQVLPLAFAGELWNPPARTWISSAAIGAAAGWWNDRRSRGPRTIYVAPAHRPVSGGVIRRD